MFDFSLLDNILLNSDSYKFAHPAYYPPNASYMYNYVESRGGAGDETVFIGPQMFIKRYLSRRITHDDVDEAKEFLAPHGLPFYEDGWRQIVNKHDGKLPLRIKAVKEGTRVKKHNVLMTIENTDPALPWLPEWLETSVLRSVWYPTTVATTSYMAKQILRKYLAATSDLTGDDFEGKLSFMLHDFGARGVSSKESAEIGGLGHLVNFMGTDTVGALVQAKMFYGEKMAGFSISASEHSTVTSWGKDREVDFFRHQLQIAKQRPHSMFASVIDSYDQDGAVRDLWGGILKDELKNSGCKLILRPDSGDPRITVPRLLNIAGAAFGGFTINSKGFKMLPPYVGMIQGDGISLDTLPEICEAIMKAGWSLENMAFGMGGGLLQHCNRDNHKFALKASAIFLRDEGWTDRKPVAGHWHDVYKDPKDDPGKRSKRGRFGLYLNDQGEHYTDVIGGEGDQLETIFENGEMLREQSFADIRALAAR